MLFHIIKQRFNQNLLPFSWRLWSLRPSFTLNHHDWNHLWHSEQLKSNLEYVMIYLTVKDPSIDIKVLPMIPWQALLRSESNQPGQIYPPLSLSPYHLTFSSVIWNRKARRNIPTSRPPVRQLQLVSCRVFPCRSSQSRFLCRINVEPFWGELPWPWPSGPSGCCRLVQPVQPVLDPETSPCWCSSLIWESTTVHFSGTI